MFRLMGTNPYKVAAAKFGAPYTPRITRLAVLNRDEWTCKLKKCLFSDRSIDPDVPPRRDGVIPDERGTVDHIVPLSAPRTRAMSGPMCAPPIVSATERPSVLRESVSVVEAQ